MPDRFDQLQAAVHEFMGRYRTAYQLGPCYDLFPDRAAPIIPCELKWNDTWPNAKLPGIYAFLTEEGGQNPYISYIGKAHLGRTLGKRLDDHRECSPNRGFQFKSGYSWTVEPRFVWTVGVPEETKWEASALEDFLLLHLKTYDNKKGQS